MSYRPRLRTKSPWLAIGLNIILLVFLIIVVKRIVLETGPSPQAVSFLKIEEGWAELDGASVRIPVEKEPGRVRILILGSGTIFDEDRGMIDSLTVEIAGRLPKSSVEIFRLHSPAFSLADLPFLLSDCGKLSPTLVVLNPIMDAGIISVAEQLALLSPPARKRIQWLFKGATPLNTNTVPDEIIVDPARPRKFLAHIALQAAEALAKQQDKTAEIVDLIENPDPDLEQAAERLKAQTLWALEFVFGNALRLMTAEGYHLAVIGADPVVESAPRWMQSGPVTGIIPIDARTLYKEAIQSMKSGDLEKARRYFERLLSHAPRNATVFWALADIYGNMGQDNLRKEYLKRARENDPALACLRSLPKPVLKSLALSAKAAYLDYDQISGDEGAKLQALAAWMAHNL